MQAVNGKTQRDAGVPVPDLRWLLHVRVGVFGAGGGFCLLVWFSCWFFVMVFF